MNEAVKASESDALTGDPKYRSAMALLLLGAVGPLLGALVSTFIPIVGVSFERGRGALSILDGLVASLIMLPVTAPVGYFIGFFPAALTGFTFLIMHAYFGLSHLRACLLLLLSQAAIILGTALTKLSLGGIYNADNIYDVFLVFLTHAIPTGILIYLAWRIYAGRWLPKSKQQGATP